MYGKIFESIYDGTLYGNWEAIATLQQFIVLANADGIVDMTPQAIAARTSFPLDLLQRGIKFLEQPDPWTRTPGEEGRRIVLLDPHRPWGWRLVNHGKYARLRNMAEKREADRIRISEKRKQNNDVATVSRDVANVAHEDAYANEDEDEKKQRQQRSRGSRLPPGWKPSDSLKAFAAKERPDLDAEETVAKFCDYWHAVPGQRGTKLDWDATFRNWVRGEKRISAATKPVDIDKVIRQLEEEERQRASQ